jgi:hypothetical protein
MKSNFYEKKWINLTPLILLFILFGMYIFAQLSFVQCEEWLVVCTPIKPEYVFSTPPASKVLFDDNLVQSVEINDKFTDDEIKNAAQIRKTIADRYNGRLAAMFLILANILFCFIGLLIFFFLIKKSLDYKFAAGLLAVSLVIGISMSLIDKMPLMKPVIDNTIKNLDNMPGIVNIIKTVNALAYAATLGFVFTICAILFSGNSTDDEDDAKDENFKILSKSESVVIELQNLSNKKSDLETVLYISTILLIVGVLRANAMGNWSLAFMTPETVNAAKSFLTHLTTVLGGFFTLLLTITYIPAIYIIQQRGKILLDYAVKNEIKTPETLEKKDFTFTLKESLPGIIAIIAPFLTGPIADLFNNL